MGQSNAMVQDVISEQSPATRLKATASWIPDPGGAVGWEDSEIAAALAGIADPLYLVRDGARMGVGRGGRVSSEAGPNGCELVGIIPACTPDRLGDSEFKSTHGLRYAYVAGAMANGIGSTHIVEQMSSAGMLGFFGSAGLSVERVETAIDELQSKLGNRPFGFNFIHSPSEPDLEMALCDLYLRRRVRLVEASAFMDLTLPIVKYRLQGIHRQSDGSVAAPNRILAKVSRTEVATRFFSPAPERLVAELVRRSELTPEQAELARYVPVAEDLIAEADSGGHTDNRPAISLIPTMCALRDRLRNRHQFTTPMRVGAAGGIATPSSVVAAFCLGAAFVVTGSINQACVESGSSDRVRQLLAEARQADVVMAPAADMFEMGVKVQVLKRGTMFAMRAAKLYELYRGYGSLEEIPVKERRNLERTVFRSSFEQVWSQTRDFFAQRDPRQIERAEGDPKHKMALVFRWYLGQSSRWANEGVPDRQMDYQIWCGPAMGAFNEWAAGSPLEPPRHRTVALVAQNLLHGACYLTRIQWLRSLGANFSGGSLLPKDRSKLAGFL